MTTHRPKLALLGLALLAGAGLAVADEGASLQELAKALVKKRASVERLSAKLETAKAQQRDELRRAAQRRADLQRQLKALDAELAEVAAAKREQEAKLAKKTKARAELRPLLKAQLQALRAVVARGIPFKRAERVAALESLEAKVARGDIKPEEALGRLWSAIEDELRLTHDNGLYRQRIDLDGDAQLADVAKLGTVLMYFRTLDGRVGMVTPGERDWRYRVVAEPRAKRRIEALFDALEKRVRSGYFELPNPYATTPEQRS